MELTQRRAKLATMYYIRRFIDATLEKVILKLYEAWGTLSEADQRRIREKEGQLAEGIRNAATAFERGMKIDAFLREIEAIDGVLEVAFDELLEGKTSEVFRNAGGPQQSVADRLVRMLDENPMTYAATQAIPKGFDFDEIEMAVEEESSLSGMSVAQSEAETTVPLFTKVDFPAKIESTSAEEHPLVVQLVLDRPESSRVDAGLTFRFQDPQIPEMVEVAVTAPGFHERTGVWTRTIAVYSYTDSQPAIFLLKLADTEQKPQPITVDFYHKGRNVGSFTFQTEITGRLFTLPPGGPPTEDGERVTLGTASPVRALGGIRLPTGSPTPPVDVELRITRAGKKLLFTLHSARAAVGYHWRSVGSIELDGLDDPMKFFEHNVTILNQLAERPIQGLSAADAQDYQDELANMGYELYTQLFPPELRQEYWKLLALRDRIRQEEKREMSLLITSDEPWVPWEMVKPYEDDDRDSDFLAGAFQLSRWLAGRGPMEELRISAVQVVAPNLDLDFVKDEQTFFGSLSGRGIQVGAPIVTHREVLNVARNGGVQLLHVATHGNFNRQQVNESPIQLEDKDLFPRDFNKMTAKGLLRDRPLVFFNTCHAGRLGFDLTGPGGWAQRMVDECGVTAFIGSHWAIHDRLAALFSRTFYTELLDGKTLGAAFHAARLTIREKQPANPTWLAYTLYGDPNSRIEWM
ncbi:MAG: CHAT domain-containing protein [Caldilineaceae bacterium]|nr:CHAT domain-containing protein [Caldilineaceae bacterium]